MKQKKHHQIEIGSERSFGLVFATVFLIVALWPLVNHEGIIWWSFALSAAFALTALLKPELLKPLNKVWFLFGMMLSKIVSPVVMMLVYLLVVTPTGFILRLMGKDSLHLKRPSAAPASFWKERTDESGKTPGMKNQF